MPVRCISGPAALGPARTRRLFGAAFHRVKAKSLPLRVRGGPDKQRRITQTPLNTQKRGKIPPPPPGNGDKNFPKPIKQGKNLPQTP